MLCHGTAAYEVEFDTIDDDFFQIPAENLEKSEMEYRLPEAKIAGYLLASPKNAAFPRRRVRAENWTRRRDDMLQIARNFPHRVRRHTAHRAEYEIIGEIQVPDGRAFKLRAGWLIRTAEPGIMSFVTA